MSAFSTKKYMIERIKEHLLILYTDFNLMKWQYDFSLQHILFIDII